MSDAGETTSIAVARTFLTILCLPNSKQFISFPIQAHYQRPTKYSSILMKDNEEAKMIWLLVISKHLCLF